MLGTGTQLLEAGIAPLKSGWVAGMNMRLSDELALSGKFPGASSREDQLSPSSGDEFMVEYLLPVHQH